MKAATTSTSTPFRVHFVLKAAHGSGINIFCPDKSLLDVDATRRKADIWLHTDYGTKHGELHYSDMKPRIIVEPLLTQDDGRIPADDELYCYAGAVHCTSAFTERDPTRDMESGANFDFHSCDWTEKLTYSRSSLRASRTIAKPPDYEQMVRTAGILSRPFPFVRVTAKDFKAHRSFSRSSAIRQTCRA